MSFYRGDFWGAGFWQALYWGAVNTPPPVGDATFFRSQFWKAGFWKARFWGPKAAPPRRSAGYSVGGRWRHADLYRQLVQDEAAKQHREMMERLLLGMRDAFKQRFLAELRGQDERQKAWQAEQRKKAIAAATLLLLEM